MHFWTDTTYTVERLIQSSEKYSNLSTSASLMVFYDETSSITAGQTIDQLNQDLSSFARADLTSRVAKCVLNRSVLLRIIPQLTGRFSRSKDSNSPPLSQVVIGKLVGEG